MIDAHQELPETLYKYTSEEGLFAILTNASLQFSNPTKFNDLLDCKLEFCTDFDNEIVITRTLENIFASVHSHDDIPLVGQMGECIRLMRHASQSFSNKDELFEELQPGIEGSLDTLPLLIETHGAELTQSLSTHKILCLTSENTSAPMWGNYANNITGVALGFSPTDGADSLFQLARPINYSDIRPTLFDEDSIVDFLSGRRSLEAEKMSDEVLYTKATSWSYENEWRITAGMGWKPSEDIESIGFHICDLREIVFGSRFDQNKIEDVRGFLKKFPNAQLMQLQDDYTISAL